jgi:hypothetical protein
MVRHPPPAALAALLLAVVQGPAAADPLAGWIGVLQIALPNQTVRNRAANCLTQGHREKGRPPCNPLGLAIPTQFPLQLHAIS